MEAEVQGYLDELKIIKNQIRDAVLGLSEEANYSVNQNSGNIPRTIAGSKMLR